MKEIPQEYPEIPQALLEYLEATHRDEAPSLDLSEREVWARAGVARLLRRLRQEYTRQMSEATESD